MVRVKKSFHPFCDIERKFKENRKNASTKEGTY